MGIAEFIIGPVEDRTPWLNPSDALFVRRGSLHALQPGRGFARDANREDSKGTNSSNRGFAGATVAGHFARAGPGFVYFARAGPVPVHFARAASVLGHFSGTGALLGHYVRTAHVHGHFSRAGPPLGHLRPVLGHLGPGVGHLVQAARAVPVHLPLPPKPGIA